LVIRRKKIQKIGKASLGGSLWDLVEKPRNSIITTAKFSKVHVRAAKVKRGASYLNHQPATERLGVKFISPWMRELGLTSEDKRLAVDTQWPTPKGQRFKARG
jgi:hypothetical protein